MKRFTSPKQKIGEIGEDIAVMFLMKQGYEILDRNFSSKFGEIDIIAFKQKRLHFIEVKAVTVTHETITPNSLGLEKFRVKLSDFVTHETVSAHKNDFFLKKDTDFSLENRKLINPFENVSYKKTLRLIKTAEIYMSFKRILSETRWQIDGIGVFIDITNNSATVQYLPNISIR